MHLGGNRRWVPLFTIAPLSGTSVERAMQIN